MDTTNPFSLPEKSSVRKPLYRLTPRKKWYDLELPEIWKRKGLLWLLILKSIRLKYRQTVLGVFWTILQPLAPMLVFSFVFYKYFSQPNEKFSYPFFVYAGLVVWTYFSNAVTLAGNSLASQTYLLGKVYFPRFMLPLSLVLAGIPDFVIGCGMLLLVMVFSGKCFHLTFLWIPFLLLLVIWLALAVGTLFASLSIIYRDIRNIMPYFLQMLLFLTPVIYPPEAISEKWLWILKLNPLTAIVSSFRAVLQGESPAWDEIGRTVLITIIISFFSMVIFVKMEKHIADYL
ncbi:MAG: ABC transporter permease [Pyrinomonadaceae bacterium]|nr:ABC transporter permease [Pyrinomonadaceae bacterium]